MPGFFKINTKNIRILAIFHDFPPKKPNLIKKNKERYIEKELFGVKFVPLLDKDIEVYQSHSYEIAKLGSQLESVASSDNCQHEIIKHQRLPIFGTQFHPEMSKDGQLLIKSFLKIIH